MHSKLTLLFNSRTEFALMSTVIVYELVWIFAISFTANCHVLTQNAHSQEQII